MTIIKTWNYFSHEMYNSPLQVTKWAMKKLRTENKELGVGLLNIKKFELLTWKSQVVWSKREHENDGFSWESTVVSIEEILLSKSNQWGYKVWWLSSVLATGLLRPTKFSYLQFSLPSIISYNSLQSNLVPLYLQHLIKDAVNFFLVLYFILFLLHFSPPV